MDKTKLVTIIAIGLLLSNLMLIGFIAFNNPKEPLREGPKKIIAKRLHFDTQQIADYDKLIAVHRIDIKEKDSLIRETKNALYLCITSPNLTKKESLENKLGQLQVEIEKINYNHFLGIKNICRENQLVYYNDLVKELAQLFAKSKGRQKH